MFILTVVLAGIFYPSIWPPLNEFQDHSSDRFPGFLEDQKIGVFGGEQAGSGKEEGETVPLTWRTVCGGCAFSDGDVYHSIHKHPCLPACCLPSFAHPASREDNNHEPLPGTLCIPGELT